MTVIPLKSLPLGFRFHPTDEELVNYYLKRKINGRIRSEIEVIPEIDVCKCEPWDLPDRALIRSDDPEWFFFSPKDRKYPNGQRANRATNAGYWKATGKDRTIKTKAPSPSAVIGMKKTLVFHIGRAPKGVRTNWIMHEYRATEPEFESGDQGGYVLYRLFRKPEESAPNYNGDEMERSDLSPTPTKSSTSDTQNEVVIFEEHDTLTVTPLNQASPTSDVQDYAKPLMFAFDEAANSCVNGYNNQMTIEQDVDAVVDPLLDALDQTNSHVFPTVASPMCPYSNHPFFGSSNQEPQGLFQTNYNESDPMNDMLISMLSNQDEFPSAAMLTNEVMHSRSSSEIDTDVGFMQGVSHHDLGWFYTDTSSDYPEVQGAGLYENTSLLPYDINGPDVYSVDLESESLQELFNNMEDSNTHASSFNDGTNVEDAGITGIKIRPRQSRNVTPDNLFAQQGFAKRRIRLQVSSDESEPNVKKEQDEERSETIEVRTVSLKDVVKIENFKKEQDEERSETIEVEKNLENKECDEVDLKLDLSGVATPLSEPEDLSIEDDTTLSIEESKLRLRTKPTVETPSHEKYKKQTRYAKTSRPFISVGYFVMMMMIVFLCVEMWRLKKSQSFGF